MESTEYKLTIAEAQYLQKQLPIRYSLQLAQDTTKRRRSAKKIDDSFAADFELQENILPKPRNSQKSIEGSSLDISPTKTNKKLLKEQKKQEMLARLEEEALRQERQAALRQEQRRSLCKQCLSWCQQSQERIKKIVCLIYGEEYLNKDWTNLNLDLNNIPSKKIAIIRKLIQDKTI